MTRIQRREFGMASDGAPTWVHRPSPDFTSVGLSPELSAFFILQIALPIRVRSGLLFGYSQDNVLSVVMASTAGISNWYETGTRFALEIDSRFALGWSEALLGAFGTRLDWIGNWVMHPDGLLRSNARDLRRFRAAFRSGLVDEQSILLVVGWMDGRIQVRAYTQPFEGKPDLLDSRFLKKTLRTMLIEQRE